MDLTTKNENIRQRAYLNSITAWLDTVVKLLVRFIIDPIIISFLGGSYYGIWQILNQLNNYMATTDLRAATALKWIIAKERTLSTDQQLKESVTASVLANVVFLPLYLLAGTIIVYISPFVTKVESSQFQLIRVTTAIMAISFVFSQFLFLYESVLAGMNLAYKRIGIRALITVFSGILTYTFLRFGYKIEGLAIVNLVTTILTGLSFAWIVKKTVYWFGFVWIKFKQIISFVRISGWFMADKISTLINESIDLILLGFFAGPEYAASYSVSRFVIQALTNIFRSGQGAITPGITRFMGEKEFEKILYYRKSMILMNWFVLGVAGSIVILFNKSFIGLWTKQELFAGHVETLLIVLLFLLKSIQTVDSSIITMSLDLRRKIIYSIISAIISISLAVFLIPLFKINGLLIAMLFGLSFRIIVFSIITEKLVGVKGLIIEILFSRVSLFALFFLLISFITSSFIDSSNWIILFLQCTLALLIVVILFWIFALDKTSKNLIVKNIKRVKPMKFD